jgi:hypothetical protein
VATLGGFESAQTANAQTPTPVCTVTPTPTQTPHPTPVVDCPNCTPQPYLSQVPTATPLPSPFQPTGICPTVLQWRIYTPPPPPHFVSDVENYTNSQDLAYQKAVSPVAFEIDADDFKPLLLINSEFDSMPYHQIVDMICALQNAGVSEDQYQTITIPDSDGHEFEYWDDWDGISIGPSHLISGDVISFLDTHLKECDDCP